MARSITCWWPYAAVDQIVWMAMSIFWPACLRCYPVAHLMTPVPGPAQVEAAHLAFNYMGSLVPAESSAACTKAAAALDALTSLLVPLQQIAITLPDGTPDRVFISKATAANCQFMLYDMQVGKRRCQRWELLCHVEVQAHRDRASAPCGARC